LVLDSFLKVIVVFLVLTELGIGDTVVLQILTTMWLMIFWIKFKFWYHHVQLARLRDLLCNLIWVSQRRSRGASGTFLENMIILIRSWAAWVMLLLFWRMIFFGNRGLNNIFLRIFLLFSIFLAVLSLYVANDISFT
jgi:magnesium-transporting ATPase (P-type)